MSDPPAAEFAPDGGPHIGIERIQSEAVHMYLAGNVAPGEPGVTQIQQQLSIRCRPYAKWVFMASHFENQLHSYHHPFTEAFWRQSSASTQFGVIIAVQICFADEFIAGRRRIPRQRLQPFHSNSAEPALRKRTIAQFDDQRLANNLFVRLIKDV
ncbi:hypothetical protein [Williamsia sp. 1138]|uniref:hypothetical protein n=1 Tax=Williamsia sp. 1138 TaxID=1903117 RepID=UPI00143D0AC0|nr:hypothetical protein [Williamsia sp. 1138]